MQITLHDESWVSASTKKLKDGVHKVLKFSPCSLATVILIELSDPTISAGILNYKKNLFRAESFRKEGGVLTPWLRPMLTL